MRTLIIRGKKISVIGLGETGIATAKVLALENEVTIYDKKNIPIPPELKELPLKFCLGDPSYTGAEEADLIIISPGVPSTEPFVRRALARNIPILSEIEIAYQLCPAPIIAVSGTDGKSTTTSLITHILKKGGKSAIAAGNIGIPFIKVVPNLTPKDIVVLEVSSFQLEWIDKFRPHIGVLLNIAADHLDRYPSLLEYGKTKMRLFENQDENDFAILNRDDRYIMELSRDIRSHKLYFSLFPDEGEGAFLRNDEIHIKIGSEKFSFPIPPTKLEGLHNLQNILASSLVGFLLGLSPTVISEALATFQPLEHRIERVREINGVLFINDSKATNPHSASRALEAFPAPIILIVGGRMKEGADYEGLFREHREKLKAVVLMGESTPILAEIARKAGIQRIYEEKSLKDAVERAYSLSTPGDTVLFSPACSSFDMFKNFEERGKLFKEIVLSLRKGEEDEQVF